MRAAALTAAAKLDPEASCWCCPVSGPIPTGRVRAALAGVLAHACPRARALGASTISRSDEDPRVHGAGARRRWRASKAPDLDDAAVRRARRRRTSSCARRPRGSSASRKPEGGAAAACRGLHARRERRRVSARGAALEALVEVTAGDARGADASRRARRHATGRCAWRAAELLHGLGEHDGRARAAGAAAAVRPTFFESPALLHPPYSPHAFLETTLRHDRDRAERRRGAADVAEVHRAGARGVLQRHAGPSAGAELRRPGRRSARRRRRRARLTRCATS